MWYLLNITSNKYDEFGNPFNNIVYSENTNIDDGNYCYYYRNDDLLEEYYELNKRLDLLLRQIQFNRDN